MKNSELTKSIVAVIAITALALPSLSFAKDSVPDKAVRPLWGDAVTCSHIVLFIG